MSKKNIVSNLKYFWIASRDIKKYFKLFKTTMEKEGGTNTTKQVCQQPIRAMVPAQ